ncbi:MAG TPA: SRPBCC family protein [Chitinophagaceae bacterium]
MLKESNAKTTVAGRELTITKLLNAPRELVFEVYTDPKHLVHWWGPDGFTLTNHEMNVKAGGIWRFMMHGPDGRDYPNKIVFIEVAKPERLVYKHAGDDDTEPVSFHVTITFEKQGNKTKLIMHSVFESVAELERVNREYGAIEGGKQHLNRLGEYLSNL